METEEIGIKRTIEFGFKKLKDEFYKHYKIEDRDEDNHPFIRSLKDVVDSLPPSIQVIEIIKTEVKENKIGFLIKYDYSNLNSNLVEYCGKVDCKPEELKKLIVSKFNLKEKDAGFGIEHVCSEFTSISIWNPPSTWHLHFVPGNIIKDPEIFYKEWKRMVILHRDVPILSEKFRRDRFENYNKIYGLCSDPILSLEEITETDPSAKIFTYDIEGLQKNIAHLQLIPQVPDEIKTIINRAKDLYIFGYFRYEFFTIASHYAFLALEAAMKTRYVSSLGEKVVLTDKIKSELKQVLNRPTFQDIQSFGIKTKGWDVRTLLANGKSFPYNGKKLLDWLENKHLIRKWEKGSYEAGLNSRNYYSHLEKPPTMIPDAKMLHVIINEINYMFHQKEDSI